MTHLLYSGGNKGFDKRIWDVVEYKKNDTPSITFKYHSRDGEEGMLFLSIIVSLILRL